ncbi:hypothetical protein ZWY2020_060068 [Hordeum vulgare]|nr:hypothetical protein ZWY2020_060068 [Hordeum vulgare]
MLLTVVLVVFLFLLLRKRRWKVVPNAWQSLVELIYDFVLNLVNEQIGGLSGNVKQKFSSHLGHFYFFLLITAGVPPPLAPFLVLLELISYCFRALSLGILKILSGFAWTMLFLNNIFYFIGDLGVAISQAHVSTISICIYLNDATNLHQNESFHN